MRAQGPTVLRLRTPMSAGPLRRSQRTGCPLSSQRCNAREAALRFSGLVRQQWAVNAWIPLACRPQARRAHMPGALCRRSRGTVWQRPTASSSATRARPLSSPRPGTPSLCQRRIAWRQGSLRPRRELHPTGPWVPPARGARASRRPGRRAVAPAPPRPRRRQRPTHLRVCLAPAAPGAAARGGPRPRPQPRRGPHGHRAAERPGVRRPVRRRRPHGTPRPPSWPPSRPRPRRLQRLRLWKQMQRPAVGPRRRLRSGPAAPRARISRPDDPQERAAAPPRWQRATAASPERRRRAAAAAAAAAATAAAAAATA